MQTPQTIQLKAKNSILNSSSALYVLDIHEKYISSKVNVAKVNAIVTGVFVAITF